MASITIDQLYAAGACADATSRFLQAFRDGRAEVGLDNVLTYYTTFDLDWAAHHFLDEPWRERWRVLIRRNLNARERALCFAALYREQWLLQERAVMEKIEKGLRADAGELRRTIAGLEGDVAELKDTIDDVTRERDAAREELRIFAGTRPEDRAGLPPHLGQHHVDVTHGQEPDYVELAHLDYR